MAGKNKKAASGDLAVNRRAWHDYSVLDKIECGIALTGTEVKVLRAGAGSLAGAYGAVLGGELYVVQMHIPVYEFGNRFNHDPKRNRKLLVHRKEVAELKMKTEAKGLTLMPLRIYLKKGRIKLELGVCRGKALHDKREALKRKAVDRDLDRWNRSR
ncbi:MAG: SsrA-binding protein SmpB [Kiritimatiellae bacterium]|nr:SsrA-binding protein SmpB [Kiritimatiellia bacterium]